MKTTQRVEIDLSNYSILHLIYLYSKHLDTDTPNSNEFWIKAIKEEIEKYEQ
jgi:hypothetical protein